MTSTDVFYDAQKHGRVKSVRDPVHGHIVLTPIEQLIVDQPVMQRLHHVLQQSVAYSTFPSNRTSRFSHSLGAMHLAGRAFKAAIDNARFNTLSQFVADAQKLILRAFSEEEQGRIGSDDKLLKKAIVDFGKDMAELSGLHMGFAPRPDGFPISKLHRQPIDHRAHVVYVLNILWQATRVATLLHDIGHLPLSHLFEDAVSRYCSPFDERYLAARKNTMTHDEAIDLISSPVFSARSVLRHDYFSARAKLTGFNVSLDSDDAQAIIQHTHFHEALGLLLLYNVSGWRTAPSRVDQVILKLAQFILASPGPEFSSFGTTLTPDQRVAAVLHSIVSGELDVDRLDYCLRDPIASGLASSGIDVSSILNGLSIDPTHPIHHENKSLSRAELVALHEDEDVPSNPEPSSRYVLTVSASSVPAVEGFFFSRFHSFRQIALDHHASRVYEVTCRLIEMFLAFTDYGNSHPAFRDLTTAPDFTPESTADFQTQLMHALRSDAWCSPEGTRAAPLLKTGSLVFYDDAWFRSSIARVFRCIETLLQKAASNSSTDAALSKADRTQFFANLPYFWKRLWLYSDIALNRPLDKVSSILKSEVDCQHFCRAVVGSVVDHGSTNTPLRDEEIRTISELTYALLHNLTDREVQSLEVAINDGLQEQQEWRSAASDRGLHVVAYLTAKHKIPPTITRPAERLPKLWCRVRSQGGRRRVLPFDTASEFIGSFERVLATPRRSLRLALVGLDVRAPSGIHNSDAHAVRYKALVECVTELTAKWASGHVLHQPQLLDSDPEID